MLQPVFGLTLQALVLLAPSGNAPLAQGGVTTPAVRSLFSPPGAETHQVRTVNLTLAPTGNEVRYRVSEQLAGVELPNDAVGKTTAVTGSLVIESNGRIVKESSRFVVLLDSLASDQSRRDNYVRRNTLQTMQFPTATFVPATATGLPATLPVAADLAFKLVGDFTVHGVTKPATWDVKGKMLASGEFTGTASTWFKFADYNMTIPRVAIVLSVVDSINLEMDLHLVPAGSSPNR
jgi:polyisoprenoid-binding protein YceI